MMKRHTFYEYCALGSLYEVYKNRGINSISSLTKLCIDGLKKHINQYGVVSGKIIFDTYPSSIFLIGCQLMPEYKVDNEKLISVRDFVGKVLRKSLLTIDNDFNDDLRILAHMAINGVNFEALKDIKDPFTHLFFAHISKTSLERVDIFPPIEFLYLMRRNQVF